ncbi:MAG TPA: hypothetical protein VFH47_02670 [Candidatus Thermoplasmatota archaeon]|nr:hypothetical protein [Candidatus Thermoplasmatota archaeon]
MRALPILLATGLLLAGCASSPPAASGETPSIVVDPDRPSARFGEVATGEAAGPDLEATTQAPPRLVTGEWWRIRFDYGLDAPVDEVVRVVADATPDGYIFGMPHAGWFKEAIAYHAPAFGDVALDLSYATHNERFEPVRFPLVEGATWETVFATQPLVATVVAADTYTATVRFDPPARDPQPTDAVYSALGLAMQGGMSLVYDARQHEVVRMESPIGSWSVVAHGYGFEGWVTVPRGEHTAIDYGTFGPAAPGEPILSRDIEVSGGFNRMTLMHMVYALAPGVYRITSTAPNGTALVTETDGLQPFTIRFHEAADPDGTWRQEDLVAGAAATYSMGIAYHQYDILLPGGQRRTDHSHPVVR